MTTASNSNSLIIQLNTLQLVCNVHLWKPDLWGNQYCASTPGKQWHWYKCECTSTVLYCTWEKALCLVLISSLLVRRNEWAHGMADRCTTSNANHWNHPNGDCWLMRCHLASTLPLAHDGLWQHWSLHRWMGSAYVFHSATPTCVQWCIALMSAWYMVSVALRKCHPPQRIVTHREQFWQRSCCPQACGSSLPWHWTPHLLIFCMHGKAYLMRSIGVS